MGKHLQQQTHRQNTALTVLHSQLTDSQFKVEALESEVCENQHRINTLSEHQYLMQQRNSTLEERLKASNDQIEEQKTTMSFLRHTLRQQESRNTSVLEQQLGEA